MAGIAVLAFVGCLGLAHINLTSMPFEPDTASYLFQAKLFAHGMIYADAPPDFGFSPSPHINIHDGKWYSRYPFVASALLTPGVWLGYPIIVPAFLTSATLVFLYLFVNDLFENRKVAVLATALALISPATLGIGSTLFSQSGSRLFLVIYLWALGRTFKTKRWTFAVTAGLFLGLAFNVRPLTAITFAAAGAVLSLMVLARSPERTTLFRLLPGFLVPLALAISCTLAWNYKLTGNPLQMTFNVMQPNDKLGFGMRGEGYPGELDGIREFTRTSAWSRIWNNTIPCYLYNTLGWGRYTPLFGRGLTSYSDWAGAGILIKSRKSENWVDLRIYGTGDGTGFVQLRTKGYPDFASVETGLDTTRAPGRTELTLNVTKTGDNFKGAFSITGDPETRTIGSLSLPLEPPFEIGVFSIQGGSGRATARFDYVRGAVEDDFNRLSNAWVWNREPISYAINDGRLEIKPQTDSHLTDIDTSTGLYQVTDATDFSLETHVFLDWRRPWSLYLVNWAWILPLGLMIGLVCVPFFYNRARGPALFCLTIVVLHHAGQFFYWADHSTWGFTPVSAIYYAEIVTLAVIPLVACGLLLTLCFLRRLRTKAPKVAAYAILGALLVNTIFSYAEFGQVYREWHPVYQHLPAVVESMNLSNAVVFVHGGRNAPVGDYPFVDIDDAAVVYYRMGPWKAFGLPGHDWQSTYNKYFSGRTPYMAMWRQQDDGGRSVYRPDLKLLEPQAQQ